MNTKRQSPPNARFWTWFNGGWVKLTLKPDQTLQVSSGGQTDEGYSYSDESWTHEGDRVLSHTSTDSRDCDGRCGYAAQHECAIENLHIREVSAMEPGDWNPPGVPEWTEVRARNYDQFAEAAGY